MIPFPLPREIPFAEGAVLAGAVFAFGRWRNAGSRSPFWSALWLGATAAAVLGGIDLWNWLPDWGHQEAVTFCGLSCRPRVSAAPGNVLFQGFLQPDQWRLLAGGGYAPDYFYSVGAWMPQVYMIAAIAAGLCAVYLIGGRQYARLRWCLLRAAVVAAVIVGLRTFEVKVAPGMPHRGELMTLLAWAQFFFALGTLPVLTVWSAMLKRLRGGGPGPSDVGAASPAARTS